MKEAEDASHLTGESDGAGGGAMNKGIDLQDGDDITRLKPRRETLDGGEKDPSKTCGSEEA